MIENILDSIREIVINELDKEDVSIALFGSCAVGTSTEVSDIDIAIVPRGKLNAWKLSLLREKLEELSMPYIVELVDFSFASDTFKKAALENAIWWKK